MCSGDLPILGSGYSNVEGLTSPVVTAASARVVGIPSAAIASLTMYSRRTRPERRASVAPPGKRRRARPLELDVAAHAVAIDHLAEKNGTSVTELSYESPELVAGISHGERLASLGHPVARENLHTLRGGKHSGIEPEMIGEFLVQPN
jgi:hypothetical protein